MNETVRNSIDACPKESNKIYLLISVDEQSGFFYSDDDLLYMIKDEGENRSDRVETEKLILETHVLIESVENTNTFESGFYSFICLTHISIVGETDFDNFIRLCQLYSNERRNMSFREFFFSILDMFQIPDEKSYDNLLGLYGELSVIKEVFLKTGKNISNYWHKKSEDKYDFSGDGITIEVKTTTSPSLDVLIKHDQLFGENGIVLGAVHVEADNSGMTLTELADSMKSEKPFCDDFVFQMILRKELNRVSDKECREKKIHLRSISFYKNTDIPTIGSIPDNIINISYRCFLYDVPSVDITQIIK